MKRDIPEHILDSIYAHLNNSQTPSQARELELWLKQDPDNHKVLKHYLDLHHTIKTSRVSDKIDHSQAWQNIESKIKKPANIWYRKTILKYAAAIALLAALGSGLFFMLQTNQTPTPQKASLNELIHSRTPQARLQLSTGEIVTINQNSKQNFRESNAIITNSDTLNTLQYKKDRHSDVDRPAYNTLYIPRAGSYKLVLSDGTIVWLNSETTLKYPVSFTGNRREVELKGEAYFKIAQNDASPFIVNTNGMRVKATGTSFNVMAYPDDENIEATLVEGKIDVTANDQQMNVEPGKQARYVRSQNELTVSQVNTNYYTSWIEGVFRFNNTRMDDIAKRLHRWYDIKIHFQDTLAPQIRFTGVIDKEESIEKLFNIIEQTNKVELTIKNKEVRVSKK